MNHRPLVSEATARPTELQPLPNNVIFFPSLALTPFVYLHLLDTLALTRRHFFVPDFSESRNYILSHASESLLRKLLSFFFTFMQRRHLCDPPLQGTINIIFSSSNFLLGNRFQAAFAQAENTRLLCKGKYHGTTNLLFYLIEVSCFAHDFFTCLIKSNPT